MTDMLIDAPIGVTVSSAQVCGIISSILPQIVENTSYAVNPLVTASPQNRAYFEYREKGTSEWTRSEFQTDIVTTSDFERAVEFLDPNTEYEFIACFGKDSPTVFGSVEELKTKLYVHVSITPSLAVAESVGHVAEINVIVINQNINLVLINSQSESILPIVTALRSEFVTALPPPDNNAEGVVPSIKTLYVENIVVPVAVSVSEGKNVFIAPYVGVLSFIEYRKQGEEPWETTDSIVLEESGNFSFDLEVLDRNTVYEFRAVGEKETTLYGSTLTFKTPLVLVDDLTISTSEGIAPFIPEHCYNYPQPSTGNVSTGIAPDIYTEFPCVIPAPTSSSTSSAVDSTITDSRNLRLSRLVDGVVRLEWKYKTVWAGIESYTTAWDSRNLEIELVYRRTLMDDPSGVSKQQFILDVIEESVFPDELQTTGNTLKLIYNNFYLHLPEPEGELPYFNLPLTYTQSSNSTLRLKDFYGDDVDSPDSIDVEVSEEAYEVTFRVFLEAI